MQILYLQKTYIVASLPYMAYLYFNLSTAFEKEMCAVACLVL